jgi:hypothetical protein
VYGGDLKLVLILVVEDHAIVVHKIEDYDFLRGLLWNCTRKSYFHYKEERGTP